MEIHSVNQTIQLEVRNQELDTYIATKTIASFRPVNIVDSLETTAGFRAASCVVVTSGVGWLGDS